MEDEDEHGFAGTLRQQLIADQWKDPFSRDVLLRLQKQEGRRGPVEWKEVAEMEVNASVRRRVDGMRPYFHQAPDGLLTVMTLKDGGKFVPYIPARPFPTAWGDDDDDDPTIAAGGHTWRHWVLWKAHNVLLGGHKPLEKTKGLLGRTGWWLRQLEDLTAWCDRGAACLARRAKTHLQPINPVVHTTPWRTVLIDLQGPISPPSEEGWWYIFV